MATRTFEIQPLDVGQTYELRRRVLRNNDPGATVHIREDDLPSARHVGAVSEGRVVATASFYPIACRRRPEVEGAVQLRFMAVDPDFQDTGVGRGVLESAIAGLKKDGVPLLWANARDTALGFYTHLGFTPVGSSFIEPTTGIAHTVVLLDLTDRG